LPFQQQGLPNLGDQLTLRLEVIDVASEPAGPAVDLGPFAHEREAELCRRVMGDRAHGLDAVVAVGDGGELPTFTLVFHDTAQRVYNLKR
jgi:hypothetical protein